MSFRALVEKSPTKETGTSVHVMRRSEGEPPYRRLRSESDTIVIASEAWQSRGNEMPPTRPRGFRAPRWLTAGRGSLPQKTIRSFLPRESFFYIRYSVFATRIAYFRLLRLYVFRIYCGLFLRPKSFSFAPETEIPRCSCDNNPLLRLYVFRIYCGLFSRPKSFSFAPETVYFRACDGGKPCRLL